VKPFILSTFNSFYLNRERWWCTWHRNKHFRFSIFIITYIL